MNHKMINRGLSALALGMGLMASQQAYSANTKVITTAQAMSQEMLNMLR